MQFYETESDFMQQLQTTPTWYILLYVGDCFYDSYYYHGYTVFRRDIKFAVECRDMCRTVADVNQWILIYTMKQPQYEGCYCTDKAKAVYKLPPEGTRFIAGQLDQCKL